jgi:hypothetical protein
MKRGTHPNAVHLYPRRWSITIQSLAMRERILNPATAQRRSRLPGDGTVIPQKFDLRIGCDSCIQTSYDTIMTKCELEKLSGKQERDF